VTPLVFIFLYMASVLIRERRKPRSLGLTSGFVFEKLRFSFVITVAIFYTLIFATLVSPFNCLQQDNGTYSLWYDSTILCYDNDWMHTHLPVLVVFIALYCLLFPALMIHEFIIFHKSSRVFDQSSQLFQFLARSYRPSLYWWELVHVLKRVVIILFGTLDSGIGTEKYTSMFFVLLVFQMVDLLAFPYERKSLMKISMLWNSTVFFTLMVDGLVFRSKTASQTQKSVFIGLVIVLIVISFLVSILQLYRSRFLKIRKRFFPAQLSHLDEASKKIYAYFTPDDEFFSAFQSENVVNSNTKIRVQWNENVSKISAQPTATEMIDNFELVQLNRISTSRAGNEKVQMNRTCTSLAGTGSVTYRASKSDAYARAN
jgi:hypothetical protein